MNINENANSMDLFHSKCFIFINHSAMRIASLEWKKNGANKANAHSPHCVINS